MIHFVKIAPYSLTPQDNSDTYDYLCGITNQTLDPPSLAPRTLEVPGKVIFHSTLKRASSCIKRSGEVQYRELSLLREIPFELPHICPRDVWEQEKSFGVRKGFCAALINDSLLLPRDQIFTEIRELLDLVKDASSQREEVGTVSHSFRLKVIEAAIYSEGRILKNPNLISEYIKPEQKTYNFEEGFTVQLS